MIHLESLFNVQLVHSTISGTPGLYAVCRSHLMFKVLLTCTKSAIKSRPLSHPMLVGNPSLGTISLSRHWATSYAFSPGRKSFSPSQERIYHDQQVTVVSVRFHFSEVHSQVFKEQHAFQLNTRRFLSEYPRGSINL